MSPVDCSLSGQDGTAGAVALSFFFFCSSCPRCCWGVWEVGEMELGWGKQRCKWERQPGGLQPGCKLEEERPGQADKRQSPKTTYSGGMKTSNTYLGKFRGCVVNADRNNILQSVQRVTMVSFGDLARLEIAFQARGVPLWVMEGLKRCPGWRKLGGDRLGCAKTPTLWARGGVGPME